MPAELRAANVRYGRRVDASGISWIRSIAPRLLITCTPYLGYPHPTPNIKSINCTACPDAPLPRLSSTAHSTACSHFALPKT